MGLPTVDAAHEPTVPLRQAPSERGQGGTEKALRTSADRALVAHYLIVIDGKPAGWALAPFQKPADVLKTPYRDKIVIMAGAGMSAGFYDWIRASFETGYVMRSGEIHACDIGYKSLWIREFTNAHVSEVTIPALDRSSKVPAYMKITLSPETIMYKKGDGKKVEGKVAPATKKWLSSNFRVEIGDLPCDYVTSVELPKLNSKTSKVNRVSGERGRADSERRRADRDRKGATREQARTGETQNLELTLPLRDWDAWEKWMTSSLLSRSQLKDGSITVMNADGTTGYTIELRSISIVAMSAQAENINIEDAKTFVVKLQYRETVFNFVHR